MILQVTSTMKGFRSNYRGGVDTYYNAHARNYVNPHENIVRQIVCDLNLRGKILDLCCGSGEVSMALDSRVCQVVGTDPYTHNLYAQRTGNTAVLPLSFADIAFHGALNESEFDVIVCSFALHLCPRDALSLLLYALSQASPRLIIISPHKRPHIDSPHWSLSTSDVRDRVHTRIYTRVIQI